MPFPCLIVHEAPWLCVSFSHPARVASWAVNRPGLVTAQQLLWREVKNKDLPIDVDPVAWLEKELEARDGLDAVTMLTSCDIGNYCVADAEVETVRVKAIVTVGLSNAERIGRRLDWSKEGWGTINLAVIIDQGLEDWALLEAMSIATEARTAAVCDADIQIATGRATGTGTDCVAVVAPEGEGAYAGLHTALGEAIGHSVYASVSEAIGKWRKTRPGIAFPG
ncbi:adenosylcobinamide amidohydrolase [Cohaesibacter marisflavi]|uniref:adenosylcobinamide amidohydrolase n=1 Tax=Cohaesibacter marisflavi TaxID=655353 RepID=UPI0029C81B22|nr:adenosylcobinamide amidohydrolase [Cohaesibacter marisflavi]